MLGQNRDRARIYLEVLAAHIRRVVLVLDLERSAWVHFQ
eukprot:SAG11_NODE_636_length_8034_cov_5.199118_5_plen_39_part_00